MIDNEFLLQDRLQKIRQIINKYGEENFYISFSGGKDSTVLSALVDMALPDNKIPRVYANTGIELNMIRDFVFDMQKKDDRIIIVKPAIPIKPMLEKEGYPFKSKVHAHCVNLYQIGADNKMVLGYLGQRPEKWHSRTCPKKLKYQFTEENKLRISDMCCVRLKEEPLINYGKNNNKKIAIIGTMRAEGGRRGNLQCLLFQGGKLKRFQPLAPVTKEWEDWFISEYNIQICDIYKPPYNFDRTGCKGCPFAIGIQHELEILEKYFPNERKQCEIIWKPVYDEYRRIGYRLRSERLKNARNALNTGKENG
jgi:3'-phosphoadenosine 5'-phosphosulfate sulfotransferase (PAPS reductase)/FAD synthetase